LEVQPPKSRRRQHFLPGKAGELGVVCNYTQLSVCLASQADSDLNRKIKGCSYKLHPAKVVGKLHPAKVVGKLETAINCHSGENFLAGSQKISS
jgi:hypothetical protein